MRSLAPKFPHRQARSPERGDVPRYTSEPVSDYFSALMRVYTRLEEVGEDYRSGPLCWEILFIADLFWITPETVRSDLLRFGKAF